jgi:hypothetical protein
MGHKEYSEEIARKGQKKQAEDVNKAQHGKGGEVLGKWTICTLQMSCNHN